MAQRESADAAAFTAAIVEARAINVAFGAAGAPRGATEWASVVVILEAMDRVTPEVGRMFLDRADQPGTMSIIRAMAGRPDAPQAAIWKRVEAFIGVRREGRTRRG